MKIFIWAIVVVVLLGGIFYFSDKDEFKIFKSPQADSELSSYEFQYPKDWAVLQTSPTSIYLAKGKGAFDGNVNKYILNPKNTVISLVISDMLLNSEYVVRSAYKPIETGTTKVGNWETLWFTRKYTEVQGGSLTSKAYVLNTPYVGKRTIVFEVTPYSVETDQVVESVINSLTVTETEAGLKERQLRESKITTVQGVKNDPDDVGLRAKDAIIRNTLPHLRDIFFSYWEKDKGSYAGLCSNTEVQKLINAVGKPGPTKCLVKAKSVIVTAKLNLGGYYCVSMKNNEYGVPIDEMGDVSIGDYQNLFTKTALSCK